MHGNHVERCAKDEVQSKNAVPFRTEISVTLIIIESSCSKKELQNHSGQINENG